MRSSVWTSVYPPICCAGADHRLCIERWMRDLHFLPRSNNEEVSAVNLDVSTAFIQVALNNKLESNLLEKLTLEHDMQCC